MFCLSPRYFLAVIPVLSACPCYRVKQIKVYESARKSTKYTETKLGSVMAVRADVADPLHLISKSGTYLQTYTASHPAKAMIIISAHFTHASAPL
jgi:hypothetical protein